MQSAEIVRYDEMFVDKGRMSVIRLQCWGDRRNSIAPVFYFFFLASSRAIMIVAETTNTEPTMVRAILPVLLPANSPISVAPTTTPVMGSMVLRMEAR